MLACIVNSLTLTYKEYVIDLSVWLPEIRTHQTKKQAASDQETSEQAASEWRIGNWASKKEEALEEVEGHFEAEANEES